VILPLTVLRRLDGILAPTKHSVLEVHEQLQGRLSNVGPVLTGITGVQFWNASELVLRKVLEDPPNVADQLRQYVAGFSEDVRDIFEKLDLDAQITRLDASNTERCPSTLDLLERWDLWRSSYLPAPFLGYRTEASTGLIDPACIV
jgi:type I restriction-modification system DNA methylase subunit